MVSYCVGTCLVPTPSACDTRALLLIDNPFPLQSRPPPRITATTGETLLAAKIEPRLVSRLVRPTRDFHGHRNRPREYRKVIAAARFLFHWHNYATFPVSAAHLGITRTSFLDQVAPVALPPLALGNYTAFVFNCHFSAHRTYHALSERLALPT